MPLTWELLTGEQWSALLAGDWSTLLGLSQHELPRRQIAVDQPQGGQRYPFVEPSDQLDQVIGDLHLSYRDDHNIHPRPFSIRWLEGFGTATGTCTGNETLVHARDLLIEDALGETHYCYVLLDSGEELCVAGQFSRVQDYLGLLEE